MPIMEGTTQINALTDFTEAELLQLCKARWNGYTAEDWELDKIADGGAQLILSFKLELLEMSFPDGILFEITPDVITRLNALLANDEIANLPDDHPSAKFIG